MAVNEDGRREVIGSAEGMKEGKTSWSAFLKSLKERGLERTQLFIDDKCLGLLETINECYPNSKFQRCTVHFYLNVLTVVLQSRAKLVAAMLKAIHAQEDLESAREKAKDISAKLREMKLRGSCEESRTGGRRNAILHELPHGALDQDPQQ